MNARSARIVVTVAAFLAGLVLCFGVILLVTGRLSAPVAQQAAAIGGPFKLTDQNGKHGDRPGPQGTAVPGVLRLHPLPRRLPHHAVRRVRDLARARPGRRHASARCSSRSIRSATRRRRSRTICRASTRICCGLTGDAGRGRGGGQGLSGLFQEGAARPGRLHHGPHRDRLPDGQGRTLRLAVQPQAARRTRPPPICAAICERDSTDCARRRRHRSALTGRFISGPTRVPALRPLEQG